MIKIAYTGDLHGHTKTPKNRTDDYFEAFKTKFTFFIDYCLDAAVDYTYRDWETIPLPTSVNMLLSIPTIKISFGLVGCKCPKNLRR